MKRTLSLRWLVLLFCSCAPALAQLKSPSPNVPTPNAASLGLYNQVPVNLFSGLPSISIPIYDLQDGAAKMPISLSYHPAGVKPENHPGWTGSGWNLSVGGTITRIVNGGVDEVAADGFTDINVHSYYFNPGYLDKTDWYSKAMLDPFRVPGANLPIPSPDEFTFNVNGYQGSFYYNHQGKWVVKTDQNLSLQIKVSLQSDVALRCDDTPGIPNGADREIKTLKRIFYQFTLVTPDGTQYIFGGSTNSIEFSRRAEKLDAYNTSIIPTTWYLTSILYPEGDKVTLTYRRKGCAFTQSNVSNVYQIKYTNMPSPSALSNTGEKHLTKLYPVYLEEIVSPTKKITFNSSEKTAELKYVIDDADLYKYTDATKYRISSTWYKLSSITIDEKLAPSPNAQTIFFDYTDQADQRLTLKEVSYGEVNGNQKRYRFEYSGVALPAYNSQMLDHWGFYNGRNFFKRYSPTNGHYYTKAQCNDYTLTRDPDTTFVTAGLLSALHYPTGGMTHLEWEPHRYAAIAHKYPFSVQQLATNQVAGGARIKTITFKESDDTPLLVKDYYYQTNYLTNPSGLSSGILGGKPVYLEEGSNNTLEYYWYWNDYSIEPLSYTNGNHVTYSEVTEKSSSGYGDTVYKYSNHNQSRYWDQACINRYITTPEQWRYDPFISLELERGKLLSQEIYNESKKLQQSTTNLYNEDLNRFQDHIRVMEVKEKIFPLEEFYAVSMRFDTRPIAYVIYKYPTFLSSQTQSVYNVDGTNPVVTTTDYAYNADHTLKQTTTTASNGAKRVTSYTYPADYAATAMGGVMGLLQDKGMVDRVMEERVNENGLTIGGQVNQYNADGQVVGQHLFEAISPVPNMPFSTTNIIPDPIYYKPRLTLSYDAAKNLAGQLVMGDVPSSYLWGYTNTLLIAQVKNAQPTQIAHTSFEEETNATRFSTESRTGKKSLKVAYTVKLPSAGSYVLTYWQKVGTGNWTLVQQVISADTPIGGSGTLLDEVRVFPKGAEMSTYTHDVLLGVTSSTDANNVTTYFEYDGLQRLQYLKDQDGNIVKSYVYHYKD